MKLFRNESGFALPLALLVMVTTSAILVTAIKTTSSSGRTANLGKTAVSAEALAEAGINNAMAVLANPSNYAFNPQLLPSRTTTYNEGTVTWSGTLDQQTGYWTITSVGSVQNPTSTGFRHAEVDRDDRSRADALAAAQHPGLELHLLAPDR